MPCQETPQGVRLTADPLFAATALLHHRLADTQFLYERNGQYRLGLGVRAELAAGPAKAWLRTADREETIAVQGNPLTAVAELLASLDIPAWSALGWADFELAYAIAGLEVPDEPLVHLIIPEIDITLTPGHATIHAPDPTRIADLLHQPVPDFSTNAAQVDFNTLDHNYLNGVAACVSDIRSGKLEKVILSREVPLTEPIDLLATYIFGRQHNTPARSFVLDTPEFQAVGFSPETVVELDSHGVVRSQPLAGTRARTGDETEDDRLRTELTTDPKEIFEHAISVRVAVEELNRICHPDSIAVHGFMTVKNRGKVQHLASEVTGKLLEDKTRWDSFATLFPAVTASGIPKRAAYEAIRQHETTPRGLYAGSVFTTDHTGALDAALVLRTLFRTPERTWLRAGAGIVSQSNPAREFTETCEKLSSVASYVIG